MDSQSADIDSTNISWNNKLHDELNDVATVNSTNPNHHPTSTTTTANHQWETSNPVMDSLASQDKNTMNKGQRQAEDIFTKTKKIIKQHCKLIQGELLHRSCRRRCTRISRRHRRCINWCDIQTARIDEENESWELIFKGREMTLTSFCSIPTRSSLTDFHFSSMQFVDRQTISIYQI